MKEKIYTISDTELGRGDITDDFTDDTIVASFLEKIRATDKDEHVTLVLNGDIFDFLKMCYEGEHPRYITENISLWKLEEAIKAHPVFFKTLKTFLHDPRHAVHFVIGNHDADLIWPALQTRLRNELDCHDRVTFDYWYRTKDMHAEHGHLQDPFFAHDTHKPIISYRGKRILNLPWGAYACFTHLVHLKKRFPKEECLFPNPRALAENPAYAAESRKTTWKLALRSLFLDPLAHFGDPTYRVPYLKFAHHLLRYGFDFLDDAKFIDARAEEVMRKNPDKKLLILGHAHLFEQMKKGDQQVFVTDTWRNEIDLNNNGTKKPKTYAEITCEDGTLVDAQLKKLGHSIV